jgi:hypothetical protein
MTARRVRITAFVALAAGLVACVAGCGQSSASKTPALASLPIVPGATVTLRVKQCDEGANAFCAWDLVVVDRGSPSSTALLRKEGDLLTREGWTLANGDTGEQHAADSPGHKERVTYASAYGDLKGVTLGWIKRPPSVQLALSRTLFTGSPAMSMLLEVGAS